MYLIMDPVFWLCSLILLLLSSLILASDTRGDRFKSNMYSFHGFIPHVKSRPRQPRSGSAPLKPSEYFPQIGNTFDTGNVMDYKAFLEWRDRQMDKKMQSRIIHRKARMERERVGPYSVSVSAYVLRCPLEITNHHTQI